MFRIGDFSRLNKISIHTLRYYDELGILKPAKIDEQTGYRYYSAEQLPRLNRILLLKDVGFSLMDITGMIDQELTTHKVVTMLNQKALEMKEKIERQQEKYLRLQILINKITEGVQNKMFNYDVVIKEVTALKVASIKESIEEFSKQGDLWEELITYLYDHHIKPTAPCIAIYYDEDYKEDNINIEVAAYITGNLPETERIKVRTLEPVKEMACVVHKGNNENLAEAYNELQKWIEKNGYQMNGPIREVHLEGYWSNPNPNEHVTEIQIPVTR
ncbi:MerR family transcriptional regulator [Desulforamulus ruminis]|uniref:Transcription activator effector binding protein n=1 Tax=Desulforamulus ruminis (strain ATCC 23193 / DSM 2154 / NCIMB 8452 / DL) TaxID=696281 RepID=F6DM45_DESRL|nr:MerR family transcriptional regulator [Desulforamulus ruminis]AEG59387.1 transcription activator effector binding protein [Desulforamulus ruminis DSM 2154]